MSELLSYADPSEFCERHKGNSVVRRCCHMGNRYVAEMRLSGQPTGFIDYVEDGPNGTFTLECFAWGERQKLEQAWEDAIATMKRGAPPRPEQ